MGIAGLVYNRSKERRERGNAARTPFVEMEQLPGGRGALRAPLIDEGEEADADSDAPLLGT